MVEERQTVRVRFEWPEAEDAPVVAANQFAVLDNRTGEFVLYIGYGTPSINQTNVQASGEVVVPVTTIIRAAMTRSSAETLRDLLVAHLSQPDVFPDPPERTNP